MEFHFLTNPLKIRKKKLGYKFETKSRHYVFKQIFLSPNKLSGNTKGNWKKLKLKLTSTVCNRLHILAIKNINLDFFLQLHVNLKLQIVQSEYFSIRE